MVCTVGKKRFIVINPFGIGDVLFTTPILRALKENFPDCFLGYWCNERISPILANNPFIDKIFALSRGDLMKVFGSSKLEGMKRFLSLFGEIKKHQFNYALDLSLEHRYCLMLKFLGVKKRVGLDYKGRGRFLTEKIKIDGYSDQHIVEYYLDLLKTLGIKCNSRNLEIFLSEKEKSWADDWLRKHDLNSQDLIIGISPGGGLSWGKQKFFKLWGADSFAQLVDKLSQELNAKIIIFGDKGDIECCNFLKEKTKSPVISCCGELSLREFVSLLRRCRVLVTNDGGPLHLAVASKIKTVSIFGPVDSKVYGPYPPDEKQHMVIKKSLDCQPCYKNFRIPDCDDRKCLDIEVENVFGAVEGLLK